jgi:Arm DNA-binding domain
MAKVRTRPETDTLYLDFFFQGKRCREQTSLVDPDAVTRARLRARSWHPDLCSGERQS